MTYEERKVIEYWKEELKSYKKEIEQRQNDEFKGYGTAEDIAKLKYCNLHIILNLIEKQQAEIRQYDKALHDQIIKGYEIELALKEEIKKKNKIIDLMAEQLTTPIHSKEWVIEYYTKKVEDK